MDIIEIVSQGGLIAVGSLAVSLAYKYFNNKISKKVSSPLNHLFFEKIKYERRVHLKSIKLKYKNKFCKGRTILFTDMLDKKFKIWKMTVREFVSEALKLKATGAELENLSSRYINKIVEDYEREWHTMGVPENVIDKFMEWHGQRIKMLLEFINPICIGDSYDSVEEKLNAILDIHKVLIVITIIDVEKTLGQMNGELTGLEYKGLIIE